MDTSAGTSSTGQAQNTNRHRPGGGRPSGNSQMISGSAMNGTKNSWAMISAAGPSTGSACWPGR